MESKKWFDDDLMADIKKDFIRCMIEMNAVDEEILFTGDMITKLSNDENVILWICHCLHTMNDEYMSVGDLMNDAGFLEFLEAQYEEPITYEEMIETED